MQTTSLPNKEPFVQLSLFGGGLEPPITGPSKIGQAEVTYSKTVDILTKSTGFMDAYDYTLNPYSGCTFGCTYCYAAFFSRKSKERDGWGYWVRVKQNALESLQRRKCGKLDGKLIYMSSVTDPYQPIERKLKLTQSLLEELAKNHKPRLVVQTRSPDILRDAVVYRKILDCGGRVQINMTVTTDDEEVRRTFEPYCPGNSRRLEAIKTMAQEGLQTCITMTPLLWLNDTRSFVDCLIDTGVKRFIMQPFHFKRGKFVAKTRQNAYELMAAKLGCTDLEFQSEYLNRYMEWQELMFNELKTRLPNAELGVGKHGFRPPF